MNGLSEAQLANLTERLRQRKALLLAEIRSGLDRAQVPHYAELLGGGGDAGDESVAALLRHVADAEIARDIGEVRDITAAEGRVAAGLFGACTDCGDEIGYARLSAYPSAKRCLRCQQHREKTQAPSKYTQR
ncbi:MAG: TraR/DksA family transcriptional regulator [Proteobacteria bacterium]|jgi:RNA polymerase-binding transcription factor DksA|nr:TraR/DksA family transcriptional regulator [Pseudomonadota bacterium]